MPQRTIVLVALHTPPSSASGARRPAGLAKYLSRLGHRVIVVTSTFSGSGPVPGAARTIRTRDLLTSRFNWRRANVDAVRAAGNPGEVAPPSVLERYAIPDVQLASWLPFALPRALRLVREEPIDAVLSTGPPHSAHLIGAALAARGPAWLLEMQDGWTFEASATPGLGATSPPTRWLERALVRRADATVGISAPIATDLGRRLGARSVHLSLAFDPDEMAAADALAETTVDPLLDRSRHSLVYTGSIMALGAEVRTLLEATRRLANTTASDGRALEIVVVGPVRTDVRARVTELGLDHVVRFAGSVDRTRALALQRAADSLLVLAAPERPSILTNKLVEYLVVGRPLLVLGAGSEAGKLVAERGAGIVVSPTDADAAEEGLRRLLAGDAPSVAPGQSADLSYPVIARQVTDLIEEALSAGDRHAPAAPTMAGRERTEVGGWTSGA